MLDHWENFYLITGGAAGALIGLMFVVVSLTGHVALEQALRGASIYMSPVIGHFVIVLVLSAVATTPMATPAMAAAFAVGAAIGAAATLRVAFALRRGGPMPQSHWTDFWWYGIAPLAAYATLGAAAWAVFAQRSFASDLLATAIAALLLIAIRNAWDLIIWVTPRAKPPTEP